MKRTTSQKHAPASGGGAKKLPEVRVLSPSARPVNATAAAIRKAVRETLRARAAARG